MKKSFILAAAVPALALAACSGGDTTPAATDTAATDAAATDTAMTDTAPTDTAMAGTDSAMAGGAVTVTVDNVKPNDGEVFVALQSQSGFAKAEGTYTKKVASDGSTVKVTFDGVSPGDYAAAAVQDTNKDGSIDVGAKGPSEPWGLSGSAQKGKPEWMPAMFNVNAQGGTATVTLSGGK